MKPITHLRGFDANTTSTADFLASGTEQIRVPGFITPAGYELRRRTDGSEIRLIHSGYTAHCIQLRKTSICIPGIENGVEIEPWRTFYCEYESALRDYNQTLIEWIAKQYSIVIKNPLAGRFWEYRLSEAVAFRHIEAFYYDGGQLIALNSECELSECLWNEPSKGESVFIIREMVEMPDPMINELRDNAAAIDALNKLGEDTGCFSDEYRTF